MPEHDGDRPAFPPMAPLESWGSPDRGLSAREHAAITLRVPDSGQPWLDDMIREARRMDAAQAALAGYVAHLGARDLGAGNFIAECANEAASLADALLSALRKEG